jgi:hypothetical protein
MEEMAGVQNVLKRSYEMPDNDAWGTSCIEERKIVFEKSRGNSNSKKLKETGNHTHKLDS